MTTPLHPSPPPDFLAAIALFNQQQFYNCHEVLEDDCWRPETNATLKQFYQGVLQIAVGYHHAQQGNAIGLRNLLTKGINNLKPLIEIEPIPQWGNWHLLLQQARAHQCFVATHIAKTPSAELGVIQFPTIQQ